jgi:hypothetical protein
MWRDRAVQAALAWVGLLFTAGIYPVTVIQCKGSIRYTDAMMLSLYFHFTFGILLLQAARILRRIAAYLLALGQE